MIATCGEIKPARLSAAHVMEVMHILDAPCFALSTRVIRLVKFRKVLRWLWEEQGAPKLDGYVIRRPGLRPRNVTASREQIDMLLEAAKPALRLMLLICSDLGIRTGTVVKLSPENYDREKEELRFESKKGSKVCLPVTDEIAATLNTLDHENPLPYITQMRIKTNKKAAVKQRAAVVDPVVLRREMKELRESLGITKRIVPHDLRRTAAVELYRRTKDIRIVQSFLGHRSLQATIWYLDHELVQVNKADIEAIKRPFIISRKERTA
jgi:integrase